MRAAVPLLLLFLLFAYGCGQKGPLYLPDEPPPAQETPDDDEDRDDQRSGG